MPTACALSITRGWFGGRKGGLKKEKRREKIAGGKEGFRKN